MGNINLLFYSCIKVDNYIWFSALNYNGLYRYNINNKVTERIADFPNENQLRENLHDRVCLYQHYLVFIPSNANFISIYNTKNGTFRQIKIPDLKGKKSTLPNFSEGVIYKDTLYIIGFFYPAIIKVNLKTEEIKTIHIAIEISNVYTGIYFGAKVSIVNSLIYIPCFFQNSIFIFDMEVDTGNFVRIGEQSNRYYRIINDKQYFYLTTYNSNHIVRWNSRNNICKEINLNFQSTEEDALIILDKTYIWVISNRSGKIYQINKNSIRFCCYKFKKNVNIGYAESYKNGICFCDFTSSNWYYMDDNGIITDMEIHIEDPRYRNEIWTKFNDNELKAIERESVSLEYLIFRVLTEKNTDIKSVKTNTYIASDILKKCIQSIK